MAQFEWGILIRDKQVRLTLELAQDFLLQWARSDPESSRQSFVLPFFHFQERRILAPGGDCRAGKIRRIDAEIRKCDAASRFGPSCRAGP